MRISRTEWVARPLRSCAFDTGKSEAHRSGWRLSVCHRFLAPREWNLGLGSISRPFPSQLFARSLARQCMHTLSRRLTRESPGSCRWGLARHALAARLDPMAQAALALLALLALVPAAPSSHCGEGTGFNCNPASHAEGRLRQPATEELGLAESTSPTAAFATVT